MLWALSASVLVHLMAGGIPTGAIRTSVPFPAQMLEARLERVGAPAEPPETARDAVRAERAERLPDAARARGDAERESARAEPRAGPPSKAADNEAPAHDMQRSAPAPIDPVYYSARELDVYPTLLAPLHFEYPTHLAGARMGGDVLLRLMVDEAGTVDQVAVITGEPPGYFEEHVRAKLASARFSPGRREGRAVKSQVSVRISFDPAAREGALR
jgi:TonB family protein